MTTEDGDLVFVRAAALLRQRNDADAALDDEHARHLRSALVVEHRRLARRRGVRRTAYRAVAGLGIAAAVLFAVRPGGKPGGAPLASPHDVMFSVRVADAQRVALVGEFNEWNATATPMTRTSAGVWEARLRIGPGRHTYAFVVNDTTWIADPAAPRVPEHGFGDPRSVLIVAMAP